MSQTLKKVSSFLQLLLSTTKQQVRALFYTLSPIQTAAICEILFNIQNLPVTQRVLQEIKKRRFLLGKLSDKNISIQRKVGLIQTHYKQVQEILLLIKAELSSLLEE